MSTPVICLLGGSAARECTVSDRSWEADVRAESGRTVVTYNLGHKNQSFAQDIGYVKAFPDAWCGATIVFIGLNLGRYTHADSVEGTAPSSLITHHQAHIYHSSRILSLSRRKKQANDWLYTQYQVFQECYARNLRVLEQLIKVCQRRGFYPVLFDLPRDYDAMAGILDKPIARFQADSRRIATKLHVPYVDLAEDAGLVHEDFFDLCHLVEPGRIKWQHCLSNAVAELLEKYRL